MTCVLQPFGLCVDDYSCCLQQICVMQPKIYGFVTRWHMLHGTSTSGQKVPYIVMVLEEKTLGNGMYAFISNHIGTKPQ